MKTFKQLIKESMELGEAIFPEGRYMWVTYNGPAYELKYRGKIPHIIRAGDRVGLRLATTNREMTRVITQKYGKNKVFSLSHGEALNHIYKRSKAEE